LRDVVADVDGVDAVVDFRTVYFGPDNVVVATDVDFTTSNSGREIDDRIDEIERALTAENADIETVYVETEEDDGSSVTSDEDEPGGSESE
jgi:divalent metal cation (Fe/Co/Zn/Cd) transporter